MELQQLKESLIYNPYTGVFRWKVTKSATAVAGSVAGYLKDGYICIGINGKQLYAHRLAWFFIHNKWPKTLDHINGHKQDNRIENLREVSVSQNNHNRKTRGVYWYKQRSYWWSAIVVNGKRKYLGSFKTKQEADAVYARAKLIASGLVN